MFDKKLFKIFNNYRLNASRAIFNKEDPQNIRHKNPMIVHNGFLLRKKFSPAKTPFKNQLKK